MRATLTQSCVWGRGLRRVGVLPETSQARSLRHRGRPGMETTRRPGEARRQRTEGTEAAAAAEHPASRSRADVDGQLCRQTSDITVSGVLASSRPCKQPPAPEWTRLNDDQLSQAWAMPTPELVLAVSPTPGSTDATSSSVLSMTLPPAAVVQEAKLQLFWFWPHEQRRYYVPFVEDDRALHRDATALEFRPRRALEEGVHYHVLASINGCQCVWEFSTACAAGDLLALNTDAWDGLVRWLDAPAVGALLRTASVLGQKASICGRMSFLQQQRWPPPPPPPPPSLAWP